VRVNRSPHDFAGINGQMKPQAPAIETLSSGGTKVGREDSFGQELFMLTIKERRPAFCTTRGWAILVLWKPAPSRNAKSTAG
jgi:hypothetical protein